jgi:ATP-dependent HslUV protease ATP-binding subunit HslU
VRVELNSLTADDFEIILTQPENALIGQYKALLGTDGVDLTVTPDAIREIAQIAMRVNEETENIGARRLHTVLERVLDEIAFRAPEEGGTITIDAAYVRERLDAIVGNADLSSYIL